MLGVPSFAVANAPASYTNSNGNKYYGPLKKDKPNGRGLETLPNGKVLYSGDFKKGLYSGRGVRFHENGGQDQGAFERGKMNGHGVQFCRNGSQYEGDFCMGKRQGRGTMNYAKGAKYVGDWEDDSRHGLGTYTWPDGNECRQYQGGWVKGSRSGLGACMYANGCKYEGHWIDGKRHGHGVKTDANGSVIHNGMWENGNPVTSNDILTTELEGSCCICLDQFAEGQPIAMTGCQHLFHKACLFDWLKKGNTACPHCRTGGLCLPVSFADDVASDDVADTSSSNAATDPVPVAHGAPVDRITNTDGSDNATTINTGTDGSASNEATCTSIWRSAVPLVVITSIVVYWIL